jgi:transcriptional regulator with XRE-family HTH domain
MKITQANHPLHRLRNAIGQMSEAAFGDLVGIPRHQVANIEHGRSKSGLDIKMARRIQAATGVSADSLMRGDKPLLTISGLEVTPARVKACRKLSLEECLEFAREDECVEVTPEGTRIRKVELDPNLRARAASARKRASES